MSEKLTDPSGWVDSHGDILFRFAMIRVRNVSVAEDLVQETLLGAIKSKDSFKGQSAERSWLIGILKHKIMDYFRKSSKEENMSQYIQDENGFQSFFDQASKMPGNKEWQNEPGDHLDKEDFWKAFYHCMGNIPEKLSKVFAMRELDGVSTEDICKELNISSTNAWVMLHRARLGLKNCLESKWFGDSKTEKR